VAKIHAIDLDHLEQYICGDVALRDEILTIFDEQARMWVDRMVPSEDDEVWRNAAHALKGAARGVGAWEIGDLCEAAEDLIAGAPEKVAKRRAVLGKISQLVDEAVGEARRLRDCA
jgi:HPt (histidine-containing phosphotransfer) domain-containing protein